MQFSQLTLLGLFGQAVLASTALPCNADNCARAITGTFRGIRPTGLADCSSFRACTVTPATSTFTSTATVTPPIVVVTSDIPTETVFVTTTLSATVAPAKRAFSNSTLAVTVCPTAIPTYASACAGTSRYVSACSCAGVTASTQTVAAPSTTLTVTTTLAAETSTAPAPVTATTTSTVTQTVTVTAQPAGACPTGFTCSNRSTLHSCGANSFCFQSPQGNRCAKDVACGGPVCASNTDCGSDGVCLINSCCSRPTCSKLTVTPNKRSPRIIFQLRDDDDSQTWASGIVA